MPIRPSTEGAALLKTMYDSDFRTKANEEPVVIADFDKPQGVERIGNSLVIRIIPVIAAQTLAASDTGQSLTAHTGTTTSVTASPVGRYGFVEIPIHLTSKFDGSENAAIIAAYRDQLKGSLDQEKDVYGAQTSITSAGVQTHGPVNFDKSNLLAAKRKLRTSAKSHFKNGSMIHMKYHPSQIDYVESIDSIMNAEARGDSENPYVTGFVNKAFGMTFAETANVYSAAGVVHNMLHLTSAFVQAYNINYKLLDPQDYLLTTRYLAYSEFGVAVPFPEDALDFQSAA